MARFFSGKAARILAPVAMTVLLGGSAYAFMASNGVNQSNAGAGQQQISGYNVSGIHYSIAGVAGNPQGLTQVTFNVAPAGNGRHPATQVAVWFNGYTGNVWSSNNGLCTMTSAPNASGTTGWQCNLGGTIQPAGTAGVLDVAAAG